MPPSPPMPREYIFRCCHFAIFCHWYDRDCFHADTDRHLGDFIFSSFHGSMRVSFILAFHRSFSELFDTPPTRWYAYQEIVTSRRFSAIITALMSLLSFMIMSNIFTSLPRFSMIEARDERHIFFFTWMGGWAGAFSDFPLREAFIYSCRHATNINAPIIIIRGWGFSLFILWWLMILMPRCRAAYFQDSYCRRTLLCW